MTHLELTKQQLATYFQIDESQIEVVDRLKGGMSNSNYICKVNDNFYTFRIPGKNAHEFVSRDIEQAMLALIEPTKVDGNLLIHMDLRNGYKISHYVEGQALFLLDPSEYYEKASQVLKKIHQSGIQTDINYLPFERLQKYEALVKKEGLQHQDTYYDILNRFLQYRDQLESYPLVLCHNDAQPSNFIVKNDNSLLLVDWEFGGNNDFFYDIACFGNNDFKFAEGLLPVYLGRTPSNEEWQRLYLWRTFQCLQWHNVALYKEAIGLSKELHLDFKMIADNYILKANALFEKAESFR